MKTHPIYTDDGKLRGFEVTSAWVRFGPLYRILKSVDGVSDVKRQWFNQDRIAFKFEGCDAVVFEPWGDSDRYWIGVVEPELALQHDISKLHEAFENYRGRTII